MQAGPLNNGINSWSNRCSCPWDSIVTPAIQVPRAVRSLPAGIHQSALRANGRRLERHATFARMLARSHAHKPMHQGRSDHEFIVETRQWDATIQAYLASIAFVDAQIGRINALQENPRGRETIVMLVSDHEWHLGEKKHWCKAIWEQPTFPLSCKPASPIGQCM